MSMDESLPSYEAATSKDPWLLIAPRIPLPDLRAAVLVCREWNALFTPLLWKEPHRLVDVESDTIWSFLQNLPRFREATRQHITVLTLPTFEPVVCDAPPSTWLRDTLVNLPRLTALIVSGCPLFDYAALSAACLGQAELNARFHHQRTMYGLRLLEATSAENVTAESLRQFLIQLPSLQYLDLSRTTAARDSGVIDALRYQPQLKCLKLRGIGLRDSHLDQMALSIRSRVTSLDLRDNLLTDNAAFALSRNCLVKASREVMRRLRWSSGLLRHKASLTTFTLHERLREDLIGDRETQTSFHANEPDEPGLKELYLSGNAITVEGAATLIRAKGLQYFDIGNFTRGKESHLSPNVDSEDSNNMLGLVHGQPLTYLRIHYSILQLTSDPEALAEFPALSTLIFTDVPLQSPNKNIVDRLIDLIRECAVVTRRAECEAQDTWDLPPQRDCNAAKREYAAELAPLRQIVLEMASVTGSNSAQESPKHRSHIITTNSVTEDADSEVYYKASINDFSFFDERSGEAPLPNNPPTRVSHSTDAEAKASMSPKFPPRPTVTIAELGAFRKKAKATYDAKVASGESMPPDNCGYWPGFVTIHRD